MKDLSKVVRRPLVTEKGMAGINTSNQYPFEVAVDANKTEIKKAVEAIFSVRVKSVRTMLRPGKPRRVRFRRGRTRAWKRAVITLAPGETIDFI